MVKGMHASILPGCKCPWTPQETDCYGDGNVYRGVRSKDSFNPDWNTEAVLVEEMQRIAKRIEDLEAMLTAQTARIVDLQTHIENLEGEE
jgi:hypothetical protein